MALPGARGHSPASAPRCATCRPSSSTSGPSRGRPRRHRGAGPERRRGAGGPPGPTTTRRGCAAWCSPRRPSGQALRPLRPPGLASLLQKLRGNFFVNSYVKARISDHDPARQASYDTDPLIARAISVNILLGLYEAAERVVADAQAITLPTSCSSPAPTGWCITAPASPSSRAWARQSKKARAARFTTTPWAKGPRLAVGKARRLHPAPVRQPASPPTCATPTASARPATVRRPRPPAAASARGAVLVGLPGQHEARRPALAGVRLGIVKPASTRQCPRLRLSQHPHGNGPHRAGPSTGNYLDAIGWRGIRQRKLHLEEPAPGPGPPAGPPGGAASSTSPPATGATCSRPCAAPPAGCHPAARLQRHQRARRQCPHRQKGLEAASPASKGDAFDRASVAAVPPRPSASSPACTNSSPTTAWSPLLAGLARRSSPATSFTLASPGTPARTHRPRPHQPPGGQAWVMRRRSQAEWTSWWRPPVSRSSPSASTNGASSPSPSPGGAPHDAPASAPAGDPLAAGRRVAALPRPLVLPSATASPTTWRPAGR